MFTQRLNLVTGEYEWCVAGGADAATTSNTSSDDDDGENAALREYRELSSTHSSLVSTSSTYLDMLSDSSRNAAYQKGIQGAIRRLLVSQNKSGDPKILALDVGTGTGLLAMMSARALGGDGRVIACEARGGMDTCNTHRCPTVKDFTYDPLRCGRQWRPALGC